jgi:hypothetical protein
MPESEHLRLHARGGGSLDLDHLIERVERQAREAKITQEAQRRILDGAAFRDPVAFQSAIIDVGVEIGRQQAFEYVSELLKNVREKVAPK